MTTRPLASSAPWIAEPYRVCFEERGSARDRLAAGHEVLERALTHAVAVIAAARGQLPADLVDGSGKVTLGRWGHLLTVVTERQVARPRARWWSRHPDRELFAFVDDPDFWSALEHLIAARNDTSHGRGTVSEALVRTTRAQLRTVLRGLEGLLQLPIFFIEQVELQTNREFWGTLVVISALGDHAVRARVEGDRLPDRCAAVLLPSNQACLVEPLLHAGEFDGATRRTIRIAQLVELPLGGGGIQYFRDSRRHPAAGPPPFLESIPNARAFSAN